MPRLLPRFFTPGTLIALPIFIVLAGLSDPVSSGAESAEDICGPFSKTYTLDGDFNLGTLNGVVTNSNQLELTPTSTTWPYAWVANAGEGTISKVDTQTGNEVGRYYTGPPDINSSFAYLQPSRTVVDRDGNCWVANRNFGTGLATVTQIAVTGGIDWNNNSAINTSMDANSNGVIDSWEILPWGQDERVIRHYELGSTASDQARGMVLDKTGYLWVGLCVSLQIIKVNPNLPTSIYSANNTPSVAPTLISIPITETPYGLALSPNGKFYMSTGGPHAFEIDPGPASGGTGAGPAVTEWINHGGGNYGICVDQNCIVWLAMTWVPPASHNFGCLRWDPPATGGNPLLGWTFSGLGTPGPGRGICVDFNNNIWMACNDTAFSVTRFTNTPTPAVSGVFPTTSGYPVGVGAGSDGNIIVTPGTTSNWTKLNKITGAVMTLPGPQLVGIGPYTYSDFTGSQQNMTGLQQGTWNVITDGGFSQTVWNFIGWNSLTPGATAVIVEARAAQNLIALSSGLWTTIGSPGPLGSPMVGRYIETRVRLQRAIECGQPFVTPVLYDLTVSAICDSCSFANCPQDTIIQCQSPAGAEFFYTSPLLKNICDSTYTVSCSPPGGLFPMGTTGVTCTAVSSTNDTVLCRFNVTVTGNCDPPPEGACCIRNNCYITNQADCLLNRGIYFGDNTNCTNGCNQNCANPPNNLIAWWNLDGATGGVTPNLANPATGGTLVGNPTPLGGQKVYNSYNFDGISQHIVVPHHASLNLGAGDLTMDAWVRTTATSGVATILDKRDSGPIQGVVFFLYNGYPSLQLAVGNAFDNYILTAGNGGPPAFVADGNWHLVAVTVDRDDPAGIQFYVDGAAVGSTLNPTARQGNLNSSGPLYIAHTNPFLGGGFYHGALDEIEITRRELSAAEIDAIYDAGASGKCPETCYATQNALCCNGFSSSSAVTICNYSLAPHTYSWGLTPLNGGAGCGPFGPVGFVPPAGTVTVPAQGCVTVPIAIACPSNIPIGQSACYQVNIFNHDTGRIFSCQGSVRRALKWCWHNVEIDPTPVGITEILPGVARTMQFEVTDLGDAPSPGGMSYMIQALAGDTGLPSAAVSLNGLPPGEPVLGTLDVHPGGTNIAAVEVNYPDGYLIGYDRLVIYADEDNDGLVEPIAEAAVRSVIPGVSDVPVGGEPGPDAVKDGRLLLVFPNPFSASDQIRFRVDGDRAQEVKLRLFDLMGRTVKIFYYEQNLEPGEHSVTWNQEDGRGQRLRAGIYFLKLEIGKRSEAVKLMVRP